MGGKPTKGTRPYFVTVAVCFILPSLVEIVILCCVVKYSCKSRNDIEPNWLSILSSFVNRCLVLLALF